MTEFGEIFISLLIFNSIVGIILGATIDNMWAGFWLGFFLGPIGWIILFLLPREPKKNIIKSKPIWTDLNNDKYKIWLVQEYEIKKNNVLETYECKNKLFESIDLAISFAHSLEVEKLELKAKKKKILIEKILKLIQGIFIALKNYTNALINIFVKSKRLIVNYPRYISSFAFAGIVFGVLLFRDDILEKFYEEYGENCGYDPQLSYVKEETIIQEKSFRNSIMNFLGDYDPVIDDIFQNTDNTTQIRFSCLNELAGRIDLTLRSCMGTISIPFPYGDGNSICVKSAGESEYMTVPINFDKNLTASNSHQYLKGLNISGVEFFKNKGALTLDKIKHAQLKITGTHNTQDWSLKYDPSTGKKYNTKLINEITIPMKLNKKRNLLQQN
jgi:hypothetical protein